MAWDDARSTAQRKTIDYYGESVVFLPRGSATEYTIDKAVYDETYQSVDPQTGAAIQSTEPLLHVKLSDLPSTPVSGDRFRIRSVIHRIVRYEPDGLGLATIYLHKA